MAVSMRDVARIAGVSPRTVSNVINDFVHVRPETRNRVLHAVAELGYERNMAARSLKIGRTGLVSLVIPDITSSYLAEIAEAMVIEAEAQALIVLIEVTRGDRDSEMRVLEGGRRQLTDGAVMRSVSLDAQDFARRRPNYPVVLIGDPVDGLEMDSVGIPNRQAAEHAVAHLIADGRRRIAVIGPREGAGERSRLRHEGYFRALARAGIAEDPSLVLLTAGWSRAEGREAIGRLLDATAPPPDAVFALNDLLAIGAMHEITHRGFVVPDDIAIVGFDNVDESQYSNPSLTTVAPDVRDIARTSLELLTRRIADPARPAEQRLTDYRLVVRESTRAPGAVQSPADGEETRSTSARAAVQS